MAARRAVGERSVPFDATLVASGGDGTYTWSLTSGALPPGLRMIDGAIAGKPDDAGRVSVYRHGDGLEARLGTTRLGSSSPRSWPSPHVFLPPGKVGKRYGARIATSGSDRSRPPGASWSARFPRGVRFDRTTGVLYEIQTRPGRYRLTFEATDALGAKAKKTLTILVTQGPQRLVQPLDLARCDP